MKLSQFNELMKFMSNYPKFVSIRYIEPTFHLHFKEVTGLKVYYRENGFNIKFTENMTNDDVVNKIKMWLEDVKGELSCN